MSASKAKKARVLIVEDETETRDMLALLLEMAGYEVLKAEHALAAVCAIVRAEPDLILADIRMPVMDGFALVRELKSNIDSAHIPVVAVTGLDSAEYRKEAARAGCAGFFSKPIDASTFPKQIGEIIKQNQGKASAAVK